jgi:hypothetical protein
MHDQLQHDGGAVESAPEEPAFFLSDSAQRRLYHFPLDMVHNTALVRASFTPVRIEADLTP